MNCTGHHGLVELQQDSLRSPKVVDHWKSLLILLHSHVCYGPQLEFQSNTAVFGNICCYHYSSNNNKKHIHLESCEKIVNVSRGWGVEEEEEFSNHTGTDSNLIKVLH